MSGEQDLKQGKRIVDRNAIRRAVQRHPSCASCGRRGANGDHVVPRGYRPAGDDVEGNIVCLCGSGTMGCHGAKHGSPYTDDDGHRWTTAEVMSSIGSTLVANRPDVIEYVLRRLGVGAGKDFLQRIYYIEESELGYYH